jgi:hypothetical protein
LLVVPVVFSASANAATGDFVERRASIDAER